MKKIIIILAIIILLLITALFILNTFRRPSTINSDNLPTGIIVPTQEIIAGELDIVRASPSDYDENIGLNRNIEIEFSQEFTFNDIEFFINPNTPHNTEIEGNRLIISPKEDWDTGTYYTFSVNFSDYPEKVRIYHFTTTGPAQEFLPDTQPEGAYEEMLQEQKESDTDNYVANNTPYENNFFLVTSEYEPQPPAHFYLVITSKTTDTAKVREEVNLWLQTLDLTQEQINSLDIRYQ